MDLACSWLRDGPIMSFVRHFGKKLWPLFSILIVNGFSLVSASQRAKNDLCATIWEKVVASFLYFGCQWIQPGICFAAGQKGASCNTLAKSCGIFFVFWFPMDSAWSLLCNGPRRNFVQHFGKKLWPLFCILIANGFSLVSASQRAKKEFRSTLWQKVVASFLYFGWLPMDSAWSLLRDGPRKSFMQHYGKKLWPLFPYITFI